MKPILGATLLALAATFALAGAHAATDEQRAAAREKWQSMTPERQAEVLKKHPRAARLAGQRNPQAASAPSN